MPRPTTRAEFSRLAGVSGAAITKWCKKHPEALTSNGRVDLDHPETIAYLARKGVTMTPTGETAPDESSGPTTPRHRPKKRRVKGKPKTKERAELEEEIRDRIESGEDPSSIEAIADMTLRDFVDRFGSCVGAKDYLDARKKIADIREKDLRNEETDGRLIERELVKTHVFGAIEAGNRRLLTDAPKTLARRLYSLAKSGAPIEEAEGTVREIIGSHLKPVKITAARVLRDA